MAQLTPPQLKKALVSAGFQVFRTLGDEIVLAERVRENLIMDSGVRVRVGEPLQVRVVFKAQRGNFPGEDDSHLFERARKLAETARAKGFAEVGHAVSPVLDPTDAERTLDVFFEVLYEKSVPSLEEAIEEVKLVFSLERSAEAS